ncbi:hypothetical protein EON64_04760 [archaeon]|nr:MAG: hypothetical protein EON64_04760 [archaeon]
MIFSPYKPFLYIVLALYVLSFLAVLKSEINAPSDVLDSAFSYVDGNDFYEDEGLEESISILYDRGIIFSPRELVYDESPVCIPSVSEFTISNILDYSVDIIAVASRDPQFHPILFQPQTLGPESNLTVQILYLPQLMQVTASELVVETSEGNLYYQVEGRAAQNPYHISPVVGYTMVLGSRSLEVPIRMFNPHDSMLHIMEVFTTEDFITLSNSPSSSSSFFPTSSPSSSSPSSSTSANASIDMVWSLQPGREEQVMVLNINSVQHPGRQRGFVHIRTDFDKIVIPIEVTFVPGGLRPIDSTLDFGILSSERESRTMEMRIANDGSEDVKILDISIQGEGEGLTAVFNEELTIFANRPFTTVATVVYKAETVRVGRHGGKIVMRTNSSQQPSSLLEVPFAATVLYGGVGYDKESVVFYLNLASMHGFVEQHAKQFLPENYSIDDESVCIASERNISFLSYFPSTVTLQSVQQLNCQNMIKLAHLPVEAAVRPLESWGPVTLAFCVDKLLYRLYAKKEPSRVCWLDVSSNVSSHRIPIYLQEGRLEVELIDAVSILVSLHAFTTVYILCLYLLYVFALGHDGVSVHCTPPAAAQRDCGGSAHRLLPRRHGCSESEGPAGPASSSV